MTAPLKMAVNLAVNVAMSLAMRFLGGNDDVNAYGNECEVATQL